MKVKVIKATLDSYWYADKIGEVFEVIDYSNINQPSFAYHVKDCKEGNLFNKADVEIINEEKVMKKSDLRTGDMIVTTDEGKTARVFLGTENGDIVSGCTWFPLKDYSDDTLFNWSEPSTYGGTFLEVWRPKCNKDFRDSEPNEYTHKLIWKKEIKTPEQKQLDIVMQQISALQKEAEKLQQVVTEASK